MYSASLWLSISKSLARFAKFADKTDGAIIVEFIVSNINEFIGSFLIFLQILL
jgi:hypothetical protein